MTDLHEMSEVEAGQVQGGAVAPLMAHLLVGSTGYAVDLGYVTLTGTELQNASDTSAAAGGRR